MVHIMTPFWPYAPICPPQLLQFPFLLGPAVEEEGSAREGTGVAEVRAEDEADEEEPRVEVEKPDEAEDAATPTAGGGRACFFESALLGEDAGALAWVCTVALGLTTGRGFGGAFAGVGAVPVLAVVDTGGALSIGRILSFVVATFRVLTSGVLRGVTLFAGFVVFFAMADPVSIRCILEGDGSGRLSSAGRFFDVEAESERILALVLDLEGEEASSGLRTGVEGVLVLEELAIAVDAETEGALSTRRTLDGPRTGSSTLRLVETLREVDGPADGMGFERGWAGEADVEATDLDLDTEDDAPLDDELADVDALTRAEMLFPGGPMGVIATRGYALWTTVGPVGTQTSPPPISSLSFGLGSTTRYCEAQL